MRARVIVRPLLLCLLAGCSGMPAIVENPTTLANPNYDLVWESTVRVVERYFDIAYESRYDGRIETRPQSSATLFEPWRPDAVGCYQRLEATLQTIRRRGFLLVQPSPNGGFLVTVEVYKELEDLQKPVYSNFGGGSFIPSIEPIQQALVTSAVRPTDGWISQGRDLALEAAIIRDLQKSIDGVLPSDSPPLAIQSAPLPGETIPPAAAVVPAPVVAPSPTGAPAATPLDPSATR